MDISKCETCAEVCPQAQGRREAAVGRMYAMRELAKCAPYWDALFDENEKPKITPDRLRKLVEADRDGRCVVLPCKVGDELFYSDGEWIGKETVEKIVIDIETDGGIYAPRDIGYSVYKSAEEAEATLKGEQHGQDL